MRRTNSLKQHRREAKAKHTTHKKKRKNLLQEEEEKRRTIATRPSPLPSLASPRFLRRQALLLAGRVRSVAAHQPGAAQHSSWPRGAPRILPRRDRHDPPSARSPSQVLLRRPQLASGALMAAPREAAGVPAAPLSRSSGPSRWPPRAQNRPRWGSAIEETPPFPTAYVAGRGARRRSAKASVASPP